MDTLRLIFTTNENGVINLQVESSFGGEWSGKFTSPFNLLTLGAIVRALEPGFDYNDSQEDETVSTLSRAGLPIIYEELLSTVGDLLGKALQDSQQILNAINESIDITLAQRRILHLSLEFGGGCDLIAALPWEIIRIRGRFLVADNVVEITRTPSGVIPQNDIETELPLKILLVLSEPLGSSPIAPERQERELIHGLRNLIKTSSVEVDQLRPPTYDTLVEAVRTGNYHVLHFYGHGVYHKGEGYLLFEDPYGGPDLVRADDLGAVLSNSGVRLVVMGACQSSLGIWKDAANRWSSVAASLLRSGVPLVIGMQLSILVKAAQIFTRQLYLSLSSGKDVIQAVSDARIPLRRQMYGKTWFVPTLFSSNINDVRLFENTELSTRREQIELTQIYNLLSEVERIENEINRLGGIYNPEEVSKLRLVQEELHKVYSTYSKNSPGGYQAVFGPLYGVPARPFHFSGRVDEMRRTIRGLEGKKPVVIWGLGGLGKTALAIEAVHRQNWRYPGGILWLDCQHDPVLDTLLNQIGAFCGHPQVKDLDRDQRIIEVRFLLSNLEYCLLIWDNSEAIIDQRSLRQFINRLPQNCCCLLTTREDPEQPGWPTIELNPLADQEMIDLFYALGSVASIKVVRQDLALIPQILNWLQGHPLALELGIRLAKKRGLSRLWDDLQRQPLTGISGMLQASVENLTSLQRRVFINLSVFSIPFEYRAVQFLFAGENDLDDAVDILVQRALISFNGYTYSYHSLVRQFAYHELQEKNVEYRKVHGQAAEYLNNKANKGGISSVEALEECDQWELAEEWITFIQRAKFLTDSLINFGFWPEIEHRLVRALEVITTKIINKGLEANMLNSIAMLAEMQSDLDRAQTLCQQSMAIYEQLEDKEGLSTVYHNLGNILNRQGKWDQAIVYYEKDLKIAEELNDTSSQAITWGSLGTVYFYKGDWNKSFEMHKLALQTFEESQDEGGITRECTNLGNVYTKTGEWDLAINYHERALKIAQKQMDLQAIASITSHIGIVYDRKGDWDKGIELLNKANEIYKKIGDSNGLAGVMLNLGNLYIDKGEWDQAITNFENALEFFKKIGELPAVSNCLVSLGAVFSDKGEWDRAIELFREGLNIDESLNDNQGVATILASLGTVYGKKGDWNKAIEVIKQSLVIFKRIGDTLNIAKALTNLGGMYFQLGQWEQAKESYQQSFDISKRLGDKQGVAIFYSSMGQLHMAKGEWDESVANYKVSIKEYERLGDIQHIASTLRNLGLVFASKGEVDRSIEFYKESLDLFERLGDLHGIASIQVNLGNVYSEINEIDKAITLYQRGLETLEQLGDVQGSAKVLGNLGMLSNQKGDYEQASNIFYKVLNIFDQLGDVQGKAQTFNNLGTSYMHKQDWDKAIENYQSSLILSTQLDDKHGMAMALGNLGIIYGQLGKWNLAIDAFENNLKIFEKENNPIGIAQTYTNMGMAYIQTRNIEDGKKFLAKAYVIYYSVGSPKAKDVAQMLVIVCGSVNAALNFLSNLGTE